MIKKQLGLWGLMLLLGGCALMNPFKPEPKVAVNNGPNPFLWQAAKDKLSGMKLTEENQKDGILETGWIKSTNGNEEFKIKIEVSSPDLRADALKAEVYKKIRNNSDGSAEADNPELNAEVERVVLNRARVLYRNSLAIR